MMYRCSECGLEYNEKPNFCDCGNDIFVEIASESQQTKQKPVKNRKTFNEQYPEISSFIGTLDPISVVIFSICIILSICSFIFIKPSEKNTQNESVIIPKKVVKNVADINTFWDDTPPKVEIEQTKKEENSDIVSQIKDMFTIQEQPQVQHTQNGAAKPVGNVVNKTSRNNKPQQKVIQTTKPSVSKPKVTKPSVSTSTSQTRKTVQIPKNTQINSSKPAVKPNPQPIQNKPASQNPAQNTKVNSQTPQPTTVPAVSTTQTATPTVFQPESKSNIENNVNTDLQNAQELKNYKNGLRKTIAGRIDFTKVYGSGTCSVDFRINSQGKLVDRKFSVTSSNNTLNDVVYKAVQLTPSYYVPPSAYKGEVIRLTVKYVNGNYAVSLN